MKCLKNSEDKKRILLRLCNQVRTLLRMRADELHFFYPRAVSGSRRFVAQLRFVEHLDDDAVGIGAVERSAAIAMDSKWVDYGNSGGAELLFELFNALDTFYDEAEMIEVLLRCYSGKAGRYLVQSNVVVAR